MADLVFEYNGTTYEDGSVLYLPAQAHNAVTSDTIEVKGNNIPGLVAAIAQGTVVSADEPNLGYAMALSNVNGNDTGINVVTDTTDYSFDVLVSPRVAGASDCESGFYFMEVNLDYSSNSGESGTLSLTICKEITDTGFTAPSITQSAFYGNRVYGYFPLGGQPDNDYSLPSDVVNGDHLTYMQAGPTSFINWVGSGCNLHFHMMAGRAGSTQGNGDFVIDAPVFLEEDVANPNYFERLNDALLWPTAFSNVGNISVYVGSARDSQAVLDEITASEWPNLVGRYADGLRHALVTRKLSHLGFDAVETDNPAEAALEPRYELTNAYRRILAERGVVVLAEPLVRDTSVYWTNTGFDVWSKMARLEFSLDDLATQNNAGTWPTSAQMAARECMVIQACRYELLTRSVANTLAFSEHRGHVSGYLINVPWNKIVETGLTATEFYDEVMAHLTSLEGGA